VPQIGIVADAKLALQELLRLVQAEGSVAAPRMAQLAQIARDRAALEAEADALAASTQRPVHPMRVIRAARELLPRNGLVAFDVGVLAQGTAGAFPYFKVFEPRSTLVPSSFYGMGFAASALPVAALVHPERPAIGFVGDGSFQMIMSVLPTAAECRLPVTWVVLNDRALGSIWDGQRGAFNGRIIATEFEAQPDFAAIARASACHGERVEDPLAIVPALQRALAANQRGQPAVLDVIVARERLPGSAEFFAKR
jgi:acetolactate synthase I/II/III large subunit